MPGKFSCSAALAFTLLASSAFAEGASTTTTIPVVVQGSPVETTVIPAAGGATQTALDEATVRRMVADWPQKTQDLVVSLISKYGIPDEAGTRRIMWYNDDMSRPRMAPWKRISVVKIDAAHNFPYPHTDMLQQVVNYGVPAAKISDISAFDGSIVVDRTRGEVIVSGDKEETNLVALNLATDVMQGKKTVMEARQALASAIRDLNSGKKPDYSQRLMFDVPKSGSGDADQPL